MSLIFPFGAFAAAACGAFIMADVGVFPLKEKVFPSLRGLAGVLVNASSALAGIDGIEGASIGGIAGEAGVVADCCCGAAPVGGVAAAFGCGGRLVEIAG